MFKFKVITKLNPTEDPTKVSVALQAILEGETQEEKVGEDSYLYIESSDHKSMEKFFEQIRRQRILDVARKTLRKNIAGESTIFFINKQVAYVGKINFCDEIGESPLGPIRVEFEYDNIDHLIDWLTPRTKDGQEIILVKKFP